MTLTCKKVYKGEEHSSSLMKKKRPFISIVVIVLMSLSALATHPLTVTVQSSQGTIFVGDDFNVDILLGLPEGENKLYGSTLRLIKQGDTVNFGTGSTLSSDIFNPLEQNFKSSSTVWLMDGDGQGNSFTLGTTPRRLGTIPLTAANSGTVAFSLGLSTLVQEIDDEGSPIHQYTATLAVDTIEVRAHQCGDSIVSGTETQESCCVDAGCPAGNICDTSGNADGECQADADGDTFMDNQERQECRTTPPGFDPTSWLYTSGDLRGCIIGDIDVDSDIDADDIAGFIAEYNGRSDGYAAAANLNQDTNLNSDDIALFIQQYNDRP